MGPLKIILLLLQQKNFLKQIKTFLLMDVLVMKSRFQKKTGNKNLSGKTEFL